MKRIKNIKQASEYLNISENDILNFHKFKNKDWKYQDKNGNCHLFRKKNRKYIELTKKVKAKYIWNFNNRDWSYLDEKGYEHLFRFTRGKWIELTENVNTKYVYSFLNGDWEYVDENNYFNLFNKNNKLIKKYK